LGVPAVTRWLLAVVVVLASFTGTMLAIGVLRLLEVGP